MNANTYFSIAMLLLIAIVFSYACIFRGRKNQRFSNVSLGAGPGNDQMRHYLKFKCQPIYINRRLVRSVEDPPGVLCRDRGELEIDEHEEGPHERRVRVTRINGWLISTWLMMEGDVYETIVLQPDGKIEFQDDTPDRLQALDTHQNMVLKVKSKLYKEAVSV